MKTTTHIRYYENGFVVKAEYDDSTHEHVIVEGPHKGELIIDHCGPINEKMTVNGRVYTVQTDPHTRRKTFAFTEDRPFDPREFKTEQEYLDFLAGK